MFNSPSLLIRDHVLHKNKMIFAYFAAPIIKISCSDELQIFEVKVTSAQNHAVFFSNILHTVEKNGIFPLNSGAKASGGKGQIKPKAGLARRRFSQKTNK